MEPLTHKLAVQLVVLALVWGPVCAAEKPHVEAEVTYQVVVLLLVLLIT